MKWFFWKKNFDFKWIICGIVQKPSVVEEDDKDAWKNRTINQLVLRFCNSCQLCLHLHLSCDYLSTNSIPRCTTVGYHIIFVPLFTWTFLQDSPSYSQVLPYVTTIWSLSVDINLDSLLYISTLDFAFQGTGMHGTLTSFESRLSSSNLFPELSLSFVFATHRSPILVLQNIGQLRWWAAQHICWGQSPITPQVLYLGPISILSGFQLQIFLSIIIQVESQLNS